MRKILSVLLAVMLFLSAFSALPITATAETSGKFEYEILDDGTAKIERYNGLEASLDIPSTIDGYTVTVLGSRWYDKYYMFEAVTIPDTVTRIEESAFRQCYKLKSIEIPDSVTFIGEEAFSGCAGIKTMSISGFVTEIGAGAFAGCSKLTDISVSSDNPNYSSVDGNLYNKDASLLIQYAEGNITDSVTLPDTVTAIGKRAFGGCSDLKSIDIPQTVTDIGEYAFSDCYSLASINIPDSVTHIGARAFGNCTSLTEITIPDSVTEIEESTFAECTNLLNVNIGKSVTTIGCEAFNNCSSMTSITLPDSVVHIEEWAFKKCKKLSQITVPDSVIRIDRDAFTDTLWFSNQPLDTIVYAGKVVLSYKGIYGDKIEIEQGTTGIAERAFNGTRLFEVSIPVTVRYIGERAFCECTNLTSVTIPSSVTEIGDAAFGLRTLYDEKTDRPYLAKIKGFTIYGYTGTAAQEYAEKYDFPFVALDAKEVILGDTDGDGEVTILDATAIQRVLAGLPTESYNETAADCDRDGEVTIVDATAIQRYLAGLPSEAEGMGEPV